jgi:hypothetical protein
MMTVVVDGEVGRSGMSREEGRKEGNDTSGFQNTTTLGIISLHDPELTVHKAPRSHTTGKHVPFHASRDVLLFREPRYQSLNSRTSHT